MHVSSLLSTATPGPLLRLVWLQEREVYKFVGLLKDLANIATQVLSYLIPNIFEIKLDQQTKIT
jgi:hypothetical protein